MSYLGLNGIVWDGDGRIVGGLDTCLRALRPPPVAVLGDLPHGFMQVVANGVSLVRVVDPQVVVAGLTGSHSVRNISPCRVRDPAAAKAVNVQLAAVSNAQGLDGAAEDVADDTGLEGLAGVRDGVEHELAGLPLRDQGHGLGRDGNGLSLPTLRPADEDLIGLTLHVLLADLTDGVDPAARVSQDGKKREPHPVPVRRQPIQHRLQLFRRVWPLLHRLFLQLLDLGPRDADMLPLVCPVPGSGRAAHVEVGGAGRQRRLLSHVVPAAGNGGAAQARRSDVLKRLEDVWAGAREAPEGALSGLVVALAKGDVLLEDLVQEGVALQRQLGVQLKRKRLGLSLGQGTVEGLGRTPGFPQSEGQPNMEPGYYLFQDTESWLLTYRRWDDADDAWSDEVKAEGSLTDCHAAWVALGKP